MSGIQRPKRGRFCGDASIWTAGMQPTALQMHYRSILSSEVFRNQLQCDVCLLKIGLVGLVSLRAAVFTDHNSHVFCRPKHECVQECSLCCCKSISCSQLPDTGPIGVLSVDQLHFNTNLRPLAAFRSACSRSQSKQAGQLYAVQSVQCTKKQGQAASAGTAY